MTVETEIWNVLRAPGARALLISHKNPDGDTLGSMLAMWNTLSRENIPALPFCVDQPSEAFQFLPGVRSIVDDPEAAREFRPTVIVVFDAGNLDYAGVADLVAGIREEKPVATLIVVDHHYTNKRYGDLNLVVDTSSSTAEITAGLLRAGGVSFSTAIAQCLLTGVVTDTGAFSNAATTTESLVLASRLLEGGAKLSTILEHTFRNKNIPTLKLWGKIFSELKQTPDGSVVAFISQADIEHFGVNEEGTESIANFLQTIGDAKMIAVIKELPSGELKGSLRTTRDDVDVSAIAVSYGGGGHKKAAGFPTAGRLVIDGTGWRIERS